jgi:GntR family transcriptional repressor for pyruvate dehydrogenase complex
MPCQRPPFVNKYPDMNYNVDNSTYEEIKSNDKLVNGGKVTQQMSGGTLPSGRLADTVYEQLLRLIVRGEFPLDCKLPSEEALGDRFGVSRPVIREALGHLKVEGIVRSQRGSGTVVVRGERPGRPAFPPIETISDLLRSYEFRINVETETAALAAQRRTEDDIDAIRNALGRAEEALDQATVHLLPDLNFEFHREIARATKNPFYVATLELIPNLVGINRLHLDEFETIDRMRRVHREHAAILNAVIARDAALARAEIERHIASARDFVLENQAFDRRLEGRLSKAATARREQASRTTNDGATP